ncbi:MAG: type II secretion system protein [Planctomycetes bacterium]|jgi:prepilin-type N-terminal cleavage/methylation domain-containing protein|nr:type II secretion system protein [Planctomycetota bacterium]HPY74493.1 type II secretion system protein [Planctomycetota bacterium]HQB00096.1 type II secretion system protein [Planctomycetota bacterium]
MKQTQKGFTLIEILISMGILALGVSGILALFPVGLNAVNKSIEDTNVSIIAESLHAALRASAIKTQPGKTMPFFFDGCCARTTTTFTTGNFAGSKSLGFPAPLGIVDTSNYGKTVTENHDTHFRNLASHNVPPNNAFDLSNYYGLSDNNQLQQYSYNIEIARPAIATNNPVGLYDITIRICRNKRLIKKFYTQLMIPTFNNS